MSYTKKYQGTGLGLAICKRLVEILGGSIGFESQISVGSRFFFNMLLKKTNFVETVDGKNEEKTEDISAAKVIKVLIAEDNEINMEVLVQMVENCGLFYIIQANNGQEAVNQYEKEMPSIIFMDIQMPVMNGFEALAKIRVISKKHNKKVKIIAVSAYAMKEECFAKGMDGYLAKPIKKEDVKKVLYTD